MGTLAAPSTLTLSTLAVNQFVATADLNGDGNLDLVVLLSQTYLAPDGAMIYLGKGDGTFAGPTLYPAGPGAYSAAFGDFNGDGKLDIAITNRGDHGASVAGTISLLLGKGDGSFSVGSTVSVSTLLTMANQTLYTGPTNLVVADFNGDGKPDLATNLTACCTFFTDYAVLLSNGDGTFQPPSTYPSPTVSIAAADLNHDGIADLILSHSTGGTGILPGNGDGTFQAEVAVSSISLNSLIAADFNSDGAADVVGLYGFGVATLLNQPTIPSCSSGENLLNNVPLHVR